VRFPSESCRYSDFYAVNQLIQFDQTTCRANAFISAGTELFVESPWLILPTNLSPQDVVNKVQTLDQDHVIAFEELVRSVGHGPQSQLYLNTFRYYSLRCGTAFGVVQGSSQDVSVSGLFHKGSRLQRSCQPNVHAQWIRFTEQNGAGTMEFRALRDINPGEILSVSTDVRGMLYGRDVRHQRIFDSSGRRCPCPDPQPDQATSDGRREHIKRIVELVSGENMPPPTPDLLPNVSTRNEFKNRTEFVPD
jgi:hypothetical protein